MLSVKLKMSASSKHVMETRQIILATLAVLMSFAVGFTVGKVKFAPTLPQGYSSGFDFEVNSTHNTRTFEFDNRSVGLLHSDGGKMRAFLELNRDGSADRLLNTSIQDEESTTTEIVTLEGKSYRIYFRYFDSSEPDDSYFRVYRVSEIV